VDSLTRDVASFPAPVARMLAVEILLADPEALGDDVLESSLYLLREKLRAAQPSAAPLRITVTAV
jgi:hypothetical protein